MYALMPFHWTKVNMMNPLFIPSDHLETPMITLHGILKTVVPQH
jgi:hypothetical protein